MPALQFKVTTGGLDLLANVGTIGPVVLTQIAIGSAGYVPTGEETALTAEIKRITPEGASSPSPGKIHIVASDPSNDAYTVREIGIYAGATLFAISAQDAPIQIKPADGQSLFAIDFDISSLPPESVEIGDASFQYPPATETVKGVAEIATQGETDAGTDDERIVTPLKLKGFAGFVKKAGDTMTGFLTLHAHPTLPMHAATKQYVDNSSPDLSGYVQKAGDTMTGALGMSGNPVTNSPSTAAAWVVFHLEGGVCSIRASYNVSSVSYLAAGRYRVNTTLGAVNLYHRAVVAVAGAADITTPNGGGRPYDFACSLWWNNGGYTVPAGTVGVRVVSDPGGSGTIFADAATCSVVIF